MEEALMANQQQHSGKPHSVQQVQSGSGRDQLPQQGGRQHDQQQNPPVNQIQQQNPPVNQISSVSAVKARISNNSSTTQSSVRRVRQIVPTILNNAVNPQLMQARCCSRKWLGQLCFR